MAYIYNESFARIGRIDSDGYMYTESGTRAGRIRQDGYIFNESGKHIGRIESDGYIYDSMHRRIGRMDKDGYVYKESGQRIGRVEKNFVNRVYDSNANLYSPQKQSSHPQPSTYGQENDEPRFASIIISLIFSVIAIIFLRSIGIPWIISIIAAVVLFGFASVIIDKIINILEILLGVAIFAGIIILIIILL